jgi:hypothetical protein
MPGRPSSLFYYDGCNVTGIDPRPVSLQKRGSQGLHDDREGAHQAVDDGP